MKELLLTAIIATTILSVNVYAEFTIISVEPNEGSILGGTIVTTKLNDTPTDIILPLSIKIGNVPCTLKEAKFVDGKLDYTIVLTGPHEVGEVNVELTITSKSSGNITIMKNNAFKYIPTTRISELPTASQTVYKKSPALKENTVEWLAESKKEGKIIWESPFEDILNNKPGDSWNDYQKYFGFTLSAIGGYGAFLMFASKDNLLGEARLKSLGVMTILVVAIEYIGSISNENSHFCAKNVVGGITGAAFGGILLTLPLH